jgi:hypothetical protein
MMDGILAKYKGVKKAVSKQKPVVGKKAAPAAKTSSKKAMTKKAMTGKTVKKAKK